MKTKTLGLIIILVGLLTLGYSGFSYFKTDKVVDMGSIQIIKKKEHHINWPPIIGGILIVGGIVITIRDKRI
ncbi:MAG: hypothetical protein EHM93_12770 [Bacteroidales bacterium]|nr:MAG: hypothetical protein EHM93_12770 [Bacteroidales bacterium]